MQDGIRIWKFSAKKICRTSAKMYCVASWAIASCSYTDRNLPPPSSRHKRWYSPKKLHGFLTRIIKHKPKLVSKGKGHSNYLPVCIRSRKFSERDGIAMHFYFWLKKIVFEGCFTVQLPHEIKWNANLMQQGNFIGVFLARHVSGTYAHHQEH